MFTLRSVNRLLLFTDFSMLGTQSHIACIREVMCTISDFVMDHVLIPQSHGCMEQYAGIIGDKASVQDYSKIAKYFEAKGDFFKAGKFYLLAKSYGKVSTRRHVHIKHTIQWYL